MEKRIMTDVLIVGTAITGLIMVGQFVASPHPFMLTLGLINLATAAFLAVVVRPLLAGRAVGTGVLSHGSLILLLVAWGAAFWIEYFLIAARPSALAGGMTWTAAALVYTIGLLRPRSAEATD